MLYQFSEAEKQKILSTLKSIKTVLDQLIDWNKSITSFHDYYLSEQSLQLLTADCTLITAIGEGINRINKITDYLLVQYPGIPWKDLIGMRNHIAHGYFELDAEIMFETIKNDIPILLETVMDAITKIK